MKRVAVACVFILLLMTCKNSFCDYVTPLASHFKNIEESYQKKDYKATIYECCNGLYHKRQKSTLYHYLAYSYEGAGEIIPAIVSYTKFSELCNSPSEQEKINKKISSLKSKVDEAQLNKELAKKGMTVLIKEDIYKGAKLYRTRDYIYNPLGQLIEEKYCRPDSSYEYRIEYLYDEANILKEKIKYKEDGTKMESESFDYEDGRKAQDTKIGARGNLIEKIVYSYDFVNNALKYISKYDANGNLTHKKSFLYVSDGIYEETASDYLDPMGMNSYTTKYKYNDGKLAKKSSTYAVNVDETIKYVYKDGKRIEENYYDNESIPIKSKKFNYVDENLHEVEEYEIWKQKKSILKSKIVYEYAEL